MKTEQIKQILDDAPDGYSAWNKYSYAYTSCDHEIVPLKLLSEILSLREENEKLKAALLTVANWRDADKESVDFCINILKEINND